MIPRIALSSGEPAGVGPDICIDVLRRPPQGHHLVVLADQELLARRASLLRIPLPRHLKPYDPTSLADEAAPGRWILHVPLRTESDPGRLDRRNAAYVLELLEAASRGLESGRFDALVTAPVHKGILNDAGIPFRGHTEYLADRFGVSRTVMLFTDRRWRVALLTTHLPLADVPRSITAESLEETLAVLVAALERYYRIDHPRIAVLALNPHAGEGGHLGNEERTILSPTLTSLRQKHGWVLSDPLPADTAFLPRVIEGYDAVLGMYHDQVLPVIKHRGFATAVNVTLGLPFPRTSVDHGTALEHAGRGTAESSNLHAALHHALELVGAHGQARTRGA